VRCGLHFDLVASAERLCSSGRLEQPVQGDRSTLSATAAALLGVPSAKPRSHATAVAITTPAIAVPAAATAAAALCMGQRHGQSS
jgi:hypothetical protein